MTEIDLLKRARPDVADPDPLTLARARLLTPEPVVRRSKGPRLVLAGALAFALAGGFLAADVLTKDKPIGATADASTFLVDAAGRTTPDAPIPPGHFRQVTLESSFTNAFTQNPTYVVTFFSRSDTWIPATPAQRFVRRTNKVTKVEFPSAAARDAARKVDPGLFNRPKATLGLSPCTVDPGGPCKAGWSTPTAEFLARQPRDPGALLAALRTSDGRTEDGVQPDVRAFEHLSTVLHSGLVPSDLRAALYRAAARIPGIQLLDDVTMNGRTGRAIGLLDKDIRTEIVISGTNGAYIGEQSVVVGSGRHLPGFHAGQIVDSASMTTRIVDSQPVVK
ncbi:CU044_5270 family protein [Kribbella sp.]|uniref:CU044_5270 family protein n=1 Tax=Kribbella sp. TaxID=1871183 RepID=UPI002D43D081|nr:CU044_5270 family protein [Kribbella sp.]HZX08293.1 CU044_5270 family protein [Kribbella sp.]